jgi:hypothetical protein
VLAGLTRALGIAYGELMSAAGYDASPIKKTSPVFPSAIKRYSNAHIVELLEQLQRDVNEIKARL